MGCYNSTVVNAPVDTVWAALRNFHDLSACPNVITGLDKVGDLSGNQIGAQRVINGAFHETLVALDEDARILRYSIDDGPDALSKDQVMGFIGEVRVFPVTDSNASFVLWTATWQAGGEGTKAFCDPIYQALLGDLKAHFA
jgi:hypothetical protein